MLKLVLLILVLTILLILRQKGTKMQEISLKFEGSPQKFGKAAYCDLVYTQSKLYDHVLYKDLNRFKDVWNYKSDSFTLQALNQYLEDKHMYGMMQKDTVIATQIQQIDFLKEKNRELTSKNIERVTKILKDHQHLIQNLIKQKEQEVFFIQSEKQILQKRIQSLENQLNKNSAIVNNIQKERVNMFKKDEELRQLALKYENRVKDLQKTMEQTQRTHKIQTKNLHDEKLQIELYFKKLMVDHSQIHKQQIEDFEEMYLKKIQHLEEEKISQSLSGKENLNRTMKNYESKLEQNRLKMKQLEDLVGKLSKQLEYQKQRNSSLEGDVKKQDEVLDKYEDYLKESDQNIIKLKELLLQSQAQLQKAKVSLQKNQIEKDSFQNRIKICEEEARMWRQSYYLNKSRAFNDN